MSGLKESMETLADQAQVNADIVGIQEKRKRTELRYYSRVFRKPDESIVNGRPHNLIPWQAGVETHLGFRRT